MILLRAFLNQAQYSCAVIEVWAEVLFSWQVQEVVRLWQA